MHGQQNINFTVFDSSVFLYGTRDYLGVYTEPAQVHVIRQSVSWKRLRNMEIPLTLYSLKCVLPLGNENVFS
jgi:hypothetical protein